MWSNKLLSQKLVSSLGYLWSFRGLLSTFWFKRMTDFAVFLYNAKMDVRRCLRV